MSDQKLSALTSGGAVQSGDSGYVVRGGNSRRATFGSAAGSDTGTFLSDTGFALSDTGFALSDTGQVDYKAGGTDRPVADGGTGASTALAARANLGVLGAFLATADASNDATIDFTAFDATAYDAYLFVLSNVVPATDAAVLHLRTSTDGGVSYDSGASDYLSNNISRDNADANDALLTRGRTEAQFTLVNAALGSAAGEDGISGQVWVYGPHLAKKTMVTWQLTHIDSDGNASMSVGSGLRNSSADVDAMRFKFNTDDVESGFFTLYGLRNA